jgi:hypothetical protein
MTYRLFRSKQAVALVLGAMLVILLGAVPAKAQCMLTGWMGEVIVMIGEICFQEGQLESIPLVVKK